MSYNKNTKKIMKRPALFGLLLVVLVGSFLVFVPKTALAQENPPSGQTCPNGYTYNAGQQGCLAPPVNGTCTPPATNTAPPPNSCKTKTINNTNFVTGSPGAGKYVCGSGAEAVKVSINFGCVGKGSALTDVAFAIIRFLTVGVGLVVIGSVVFAGIQYSASKGDPNATSQAIERIRSALYMLLIFIFAAAILNFIIPEGFFR